MTDEMFDAPGRFWRGNLHTHSDVSDGRLPPGEVCRLYREAGYDFMSLTDHFIGRYGYPITDTRAFRTDAFTTIPGAELHSGAMENGDIWHILAVGLPDDFAPSDSPDFHAHEGQETGPALAARARAAGAYVAVAHPEWSGMSTADARTIEAAHAVEVYNHGCWVSCDRAHGHYTLDRLLEEGRRLTLCATDDAHFHDPDAFGGWVMVKAAENSPEALLAALKAGRSYASTGPEIHEITWHEDRVDIASSPVDAMILQGPGTKTSSVHGHGLTKATIPFGKVAGSPWMRVTIVTGDGKRAWTNPVWP